MPLKCAAFGFRKPSCEAGITILQRLSSRRLSKRFEKGFAVSELSQGADVAQIFSEARELCAIASRPLTSAYLLLAMFTVQNDAGALMLFHKITEERLTDRFDRDDCEDVSMTELRDRAVQCATRLQDHKVTSLHLLAAIIALPQCAAYRLLERCLKDTPLTLPQLYILVLRRMGKVSLDDDEEEIRNTMEISLGLAEESCSDENDTVEVALVDCDYERGRCDTLSIDRRRAPKFRSSELQSGLQRPDLCVIPYPQMEQSFNPPNLHCGQGVQSVPRPRAESPFAHPIPQSAPSPRSFALNAVPPIPNPRNLSATETHQPPQTAPEARSDLRRALQTEPEKAPAIPSIEPQAPKAPAPMPEEAEDAEEEALDLKKLSALQKSTMAALLDGQSPYLLKLSRFPILTKLGKNLSHCAYLKRLDPVIGRDREIEETLDILNKRRSNNPCLIGEPGVGKTSVAEGLAQLLVKRHQESPQRTCAPDRVIIQIEPGALLAGTHLRGSLSERLRGLQAEIRDAGGRVILFIDEIHSLLGSGPDGSHDAAQELKAALARGEFPCIGATTYTEYRSCIASDPALERRFTPVEIDEPDPQSTLQIIEGAAKAYADHHKVELDRSVLPAIVRLGRRYISDRRDPDKSLSILDLAGAIAKRDGGKLDLHAVAQVISRVAKIPIEHLLTDDPTRFLEMESHMAQHIVGQPHVLTALAQTLRRSLAGFGGKRPMGSMLFLGPTGVGKTEVVKVLAEFLFGTREAMTRFDMSEYLEAHTIARLIGAPPGYVGFDEGGQLTDAVRRRPYQILLFDEIEKSCKDIWNLLLQILEEGQLTDSKGRKVDFSNTVVILTSNLGAGAFEENRRMGFGGNASETDLEQRRERALKKAKEAFPPELWNRIECRLVFNPLSKEQIARVAHLICAERSHLLQEERDLAFSLSDKAVELLIDKGGYDPALGARPMRQAIAKEIETPLAAAVLRGDFNKGARLLADVSDAGEIIFTPVITESSSDTIASPAI